MVLALILLAGGAGGLFAQSAGEPGAALIPGSLKNNRYFLESQRLTALAKESYEEGDYDASTDYAAEALRYARLSDEYVAIQLKIRETDQAIGAARGRLDWARSMEAPRRYPKEYGAAEGEFAAARQFRGEEDWDEAIAAARRVLVFLAGVEALPPGGVLPAQYLVRTWDSLRDCLWNIAGQPWAYGDSFKWRILYEANREKLPNPRNPNLIEPGTVLDIPSIQGELRRGLWEEGREYPALGR
jgi:nucleoid-associated protein YgaU